MSALKLSTIGIGLGSTICLWDCYYQEDRASCHSYKDAIKEWWALRGAQCLGFVASKLFYLEYRNFAKTQEYMRMLNGKSDGVDADNYENLSRVRWMRRGWMLMDKWRYWRNLGLVFDNIDHRYPRAVSHLRRIALVPGGSRLYISCEKNPSSWLYTEPISSRFIQDEEVREYVRAVCACRDENLAMLQGSPRGALDLFDNLIKEKKRLDIRNCRLFDRERKPVLSKVLRAEIEAHGLYLAAPKRARLMNLTIPHKAGDPEKPIKLDLLFPKLSLLIDTSVVADEDSRDKFMAMTEERAPLYAPFLFTGSELVPEYIVGINLSNKWRQFVMDPTLGEYIFRKADSDEVVEYSDLAPGNSYRVTLKAWKTKLGHLAETDLPFALRLVGFTESPLGDHSGAPIVEVASEKREPVFTDPSRHSMFSFPARAWRWYVELTVSEKNLLWGIQGVVMGSVIGAYKYVDKQANRTSDHLEITYYKVGRSKVKEFEAAWNEAARLAQRQRGYEWTRMYKAIAWEQSPFQYLCMRMWSQKVDKDYFLRHNRKVHDELESRIEAASEGKEMNVYKYVVDDSIVRVIQ